MPDPYDEHFDYYEVVVGRCTIEGCKWEVSLSWDDLEPDGGARHKYLTHWAAVHESESGPPGTGDTHGV